MNLPFAFEEPFFDREVHAYDLRLAKALIKSKEKPLNRKIYGWSASQIIIDDILFDDKGTTEVKQNQ